MCFGYRSSAVREKKWTVLSAEFELQADSTESIISRMNAYNASRREKQPLQYPSAGSFFKRPADNYAGALIEQAGLKGFSIGGAKVSELHAGFLINTGNARALDFIRLMAHVQNTVFLKTCIWLLPEVHIIGQEKE